MTRHRVAIEGLTMRDGRLIQHGALYSFTEKLPVTMQYNYNKIIGIATDFERDAATGEITYDIKTKENVNGMFANIYCQPITVIRDEESSKMIIIEANIRSITFLPGPWNW